MVIKYRENNMLKFFIIEKNLKKTINIMTMFIMGKCEVEHKKVLYRMLKSGENNEMEYGME